MFAVDRSSTPAVADAANDDSAVRQRLDSFKLGKVMPQPLSSVAQGGPTGHKHRRSHSRTTSISSSSSIAASLSSSRSSGLNDMASFSFGTLSSSASASTMSSSGSISSSLANASTAVASSSKRNSHHRRRSSVSTRRESAELMGVSLPDLPIASLEDNVNLGEKDSIRRRALWALEGKHSVSFNKVEIPELSTPDAEKMMFDFASKPTLAGGLSTGFGNSIMGGKRDSFKLLSSSGSSKDQLHTLLEEEEEEEDSAPQCEKDPQDTLPSPTTSNEDHFSLLTATEPEPVVAITKPTPVRPRPATLNLRPLSLTPDNLGATGLPTPSLTPSPRSGLRSLALNPATSSIDESRLDGVKHGVVSRRPVLNLSIDSSSDTSSQPDDHKPIRRSSISYRTSSQSGSNSAALPTPEMTPVLSRRCSVSESIRSSRSGDDDFFPAHPSYRPLSVSEQHFLYKSHNALLARITDLEKALSMRRMSMGGYSISGGSRPSSLVSDTSFPNEVASPAEGEPSDEMFALIRDLKAERDELKKDVDGWRMRVADLDKQLVLVAKRVENERKEAWVARSRVGLLEAEKAALERRVGALDKVVADSESWKLDLEKENKALVQQVDEREKRIQELEAELLSAKQALESERSRTTQGLSSENYDSEFMATPTPDSFDGQCNRGLGFSMDSSVDVSFNFGFPSARVVESQDPDSDEDDGLAEYEDEEDGYSDMDTSSSFDSLTDCPARSTAHLSLETTPEHEAQTSPSITTPTMPSRPGHRSQHSLSKVWTFPKAVTPSTRDERSHKQTESVDKFFGCLDESDASDESGPVTPMLFSYEESKDLFASGFKYADDTEVAFYLPDGVGTVVEEPEVEVKNERSLDVVTEEEEDTLSEAENDEDMFGEAGGIRITFTPPDDVEPEKEIEQIRLATPVKPVSAPPRLPALDFGYDDDGDKKDVILPFTFGHASAEKVSGPSSPATEPSSIPRCHPPPTMITPPSSLPRPTTRTASPPSAIPRPASRTSAVPASPRNAQSNSNFVTPPSKRGGGIPSFIPQPVSSPSPSRVSLSRPKNAISGPTFVRQPSRTNPLTPLSSSTISKPHNASVRNGSAFQPMNSIIHPLTFTPQSQPRPKVTSGIARLPLKRT